MNVQNFWFSFQNTTCARFFKFILCIEFMKIVRFILIYLKILLAILFQMIIKRNFNNFRFFCFLFQISSCDNWQKFNFSFKMMKTFIKYIGLIIIFWPLCELYILMHINYNIILIIVYYIYIVVYINGSWYDEN